jgi:glycerol-3-phosphate dehydrogenase
MINTNNNPNFIYDLIVVGGGITGAGVARDAALRGLSCLLLEKGDFASGVTSKSTRLIHGGLRYLANFEVDLVAESLRERAILRQQAPYLIHPLPILIPIYKEDPHGRAIMSIGIHLYDLLSHEKDVPHYFTSNREKTLGFEPRLNRDGLTGSALFYDHQIMMPERLVMENSISARKAGAVLLSYHCVEKIVEQGNITVTARDVLSGGVRTFHAKVLVNASGPWIDTVRQAGDINEKKIIHPTKGIHLVLPKLTEQALFVTSRDGRMFFIIPLGAYSLIGTTDTEYRGDLDEVYAQKDEVDYLLTESKRILPGMNLAKESILYTYAGIRPLAFSGTSESKISRKHRVIKEGRSGRIITIAGGKLTTYRNMAKDTVNAVCKALGRAAECVTDQQPLPGGLPVSYEEYMREALPELSSRYAMAPETVRHLISFYGARAEEVLELARKEPSLRAPISPDSRDVYAQVLLGVREEGAKTLSDIILRRMHLGISAGRGDQQAEKIAALAGKELGWSDDEIKHRVEQFRADLDKNRFCLKC